MRFCRLVEEGSRNSHLNRGEDEGVGDDNVLTAGDVEDDDLGNVLRSQRLHATIDSSSVRRELASLGPGFELTHRWQLPWPCRRGSERLRIP